jgi:hypothetical protein
MTPKTASTFRIDDELLAALREVKERDGVPISEQVRRALLLWIESKGVTVKAPSRRSGKQRKG